MKKLILYFPDPIQGGSAVATPPPAPSPAPAAIAPASPPPAPAPSDDPFELPKKPDAAPPKPADAPRPAAQPDIDRLAPKELRDRVKQQNKERAEMDGKIASLETKIKEYEARGADTTTLQSRLSALEKERNAAMESMDAVKKERDAAQAELRAARQEASPEFKEKYDKPFNRAAENARSEISQLTVITDPETQETRPATWEDFAAIYQMPTGKAIEQANAMFGASAQYVLQVRRELQNLDRVRKDALEDERKQFKERSAQELAQSAKEREDEQRMLSETQNRLAEAVDDYKIDPTDTEISQAVKHAREVFDKPINAADRADFIKQKTLKWAHIRERATVGYISRGIKLQRANSKIAELEAQVAELKGVAPGKNNRPTSQQTGDEPDNDSQWIANAKKSIEGAL